MKFTICVGVVFQQGGYSIKFLVNELYGHLWNSPYEVLKLCVPSLLYTVQNNLLYCALTNLDAATYQVCYQLKILTTALFSAVLLKVRYICDPIWNQPEFSKSCFILNIIIFFHSLAQILWSEVALSRSSYSWSNHCPKLGYNGCSLSSSRKNRRSKPFIGSRLCSLCGMHFWLCWSLF